MGRHGPFLRPYVAKYSVFKFEPCAQSGHELMCRAGWEGKNFDASHDLKCVTECPCMMASAYRYCDMHDVVAKVMASL